MILLDANILLYAYLEAFPQHKTVAQWLEELLSRRHESVLVTWTVATAFLRISTNRRIFKVPSSITEANNRLDGLFSHPMVQLIGPTASHWPIFSKILMEMNLSGDVVMDAHIAAMAVENNAAVASADKDFRRFSDYVKIIDPLAI